MSSQKTEYYNMDVEPILNTPQMRELQEKKLQPTLRYFYDNVPFDRRRMDAAGIKPEDINSLDELSNALPFVGQEDFRAIFEEVQLDMGKAFQIIFGDDRMNDIHMMTTTSGTTGVPTPYPVFHKTTDTMGELFARIAHRMGIGAGDRMGVCFGLSMHAAGTPHLHWYKKVPGLTIFPIGAEAGTEKILQLMKLFKINIFSGTPSLASHLIERSPEVLGEPVSNLGIKILGCGAEPGAGVPEVRDHLEKSYGAKLFDGGAGYGCSCDHPVYQGMHWIADDYCYYELVDPETHKPVPMEHGASGLAVFTPLEPDSTIFFSNLRFTLNDIHQVFTDPCPCGKTGFRYRIVGRADDMLKVKGVPVYPAAIQGVINGFLPRVTGAFRVVLEVEPPRVVPPLKLKVEFGVNETRDNLPAIEKEILQRMHSDLKIRPEITWLEPNTLERSDKKTQLLEKAY